MQAVAFRDNVSRQTFEEDNDLYCSSGDGMLYFLFSLNIHIIFQMSN